MRTMGSTNVCFFLYPFSGIPVMNGISLGICAVDYHANNSSMTPDTPGIIVDDVSYF